MKLISAVTIFCLFTTGCMSTKKHVFTIADLVVLNNYHLNPSVSFSNDKNFISITTEYQFFKTFTMTRTSFGSAIIPDFSKQSVVAIILKPTEKVISVNINKAATIGNTLQIYYSITDTTSWKNYTHIPMIVAVVPNNKRVQQVDFHNEDNKKSIISVAY